MKKEEKEKKYKIFKVFMTKKELKKGIKRKKRLVTVVQTIVVIAAILIAIQYIYMKRQMSLYNVDDGYTCVHMSYDREKFFEGLGFRTVQRRVEGVHRWIAIELWDGMYIDYESTLNLFGMYLINNRMRGQPIQQSEGYFDGKNERVTINTKWDMHTVLHDWEVIGYVGYNTNIDFFNLFAGKSPSSEPGRG